ncbi:MAG: LysR family transcriptional regulator [Phaeovulum sp.]|uniref:LysR family transcriptional regulator n=1 Tax=Phaeovulum sp. TaxID=2934796 RepID=UPI002730E0DB|nr:LysR family transcriptional regulator [Phaeovulum sp.]MDP2062412.1 LysR family transcriptional regulator [Phaeovulum sp.]MDP3862165.1 LysR family transcriptional regulator [Phaeovulum sp.]
MKPYEQRFPWNLDWNLLRTFMVVVEQRGITRAANFLGVRQPTISAALKRLEEMVGQRLVDRRPSHFTVSEAGQILYRECSLVFGAVSQLPGLLNAAKNRISGHVSIMMTSGVVCRHFDELLETFNKNYPDVTYSIVVAESSEVLNTLRQNGATLGICLMRESDHVLDAQVLFRGFFGLYCGPHHRLFGKEKIKLSELRGENSVSYQTDAESGPLHSVTHLREQALLRTELKGISANLPEVRRMIVVGLGIGALPVHVAQRDVQAGNLWRLPPYAGIPAVDVFFVTNPNRSTNPAESKLIAAITELIRTVRLEERTYQ